MYHSAPLVMPSRNSRLARILGCKLAYANATVRNTASSGQAEYLKQTHSNNRQAKKKTKHSQARSSFRVSVPGIVRHQVAAVKIHRQNLFFCLTSKEEEKKKK
jgi:hypothetical protein